MKFKVGKCRKTLHADRWEIVFLRSNYVIDVPTNVAIRLARRRARVIVKKDIGTLAYRIKNDIQLERRRKYYLASVFTAIAGNSSVIGGDLNPPTIYDE